MENHNPINYKTLGKRFAFTPPKKEIEKLINSLSSATIKVYKKKPLNK